MSETETQPAGQDQQQAPKGMTINAQFLRDLSFENPNAPMSFMAMQQSPEISVDMNVRHRSIQGRTHESVLKVSASAKTGETTAFVVECEYAGIVTFGDDISDDNIEALLVVEVPRLLFPFARQVVTEAVQGGGFPPLLINPIDFRIFLAKKKAADAAAAQAGDAVN